ncbi:MAG: hypothetical protein IRZ16_02760 [Myxococcaceae bacterium]|nr:hypothetical protein [Myxococcaceae bacterium]
MSPLRLTAAALLLFCAFACGPQNGDADAGIPDDAGLPSDDAGAEPDAGRKDAGTPDAGPVDAGVTAFPVEQWCDHLARARCFQKQRCLSLADEQLADCLQREKSACPQEAYTLGVHQMRLQYLPQQAADCINAYAEGSCIEPPAACEPVFQGFVDADGGCLLAEECRLGTYCLTSESKCPFTCYAYRAPGEPCNFWDQQCDPNESTCTFLDGGYTCVARKNEGEPCVFWSDCRADLGCINGACIKQRAGLGETCQESSGYPVCEADLFCRQEPVPQGQTPDAGMCMKRAALGGVCSGYGTCLPGLRCSSNYATGTCIPLGKEGDICSNYDDCKAELYCDPATSRCKPLPRDGGDCSSQGSFYECAPGYYCESTNDVCTPLADLGEPCTYDGVCRSGSCEYGPVPDAGYGYRCVPSCLEQLDGGF